MLKAEIKNKLEELEKDREVLLGRIESLQSELLILKEEKSFVKKENERLSEPCNLRLSGLPEFLFSLYKASDDAELRSRLNSWLKNF